MTSSAPATSPDLLALLARGARAYHARGSRAEVTVEGGSVTFHGAVVRGLEIYGGDCAALWSAEHDTDLSGFDGITLRARGDGRIYLVRLRTRETFAEVAYATEIAPPEGAWADIEVPFSSFEASTTFQVLPGHPPLDPAAVTTLGLATYWQEGPFSLEITAITGYRMSPGAAPPPAADAEVWARWLHEVLFPLALVAAGLSGETTPVDIFAGAGARREDRRIPCYEDSAEIRTEELLVVRAALQAARRAGDARSRLTGQAIVYLAMEAAYELAIAADLVADVSAVGSVPLEFLDREAAAEKAFEPFQRLDDAIAAALRAAGLALDEA
ncbi:MAG: CIA30 family protein [Byssovorax sp.]